ncbi:MAG: DnaD domain protein [Lactobacillaceae bacterium]|jgi:DNA replication protein|nr:DnaD domain protein [Lactobacillaceae bacterium]
MAIKNNQLNRILDKGTLQVPLFLIENYRDLNITNDELIILLQVFAFRQIGNPFPTAQVLSERTNFSITKINDLITKLLQKKILSLSSNNSQFVFDGLYDLMTSGQIAITNKADETSINDRQRIFQIVSNEFGRELSPIEISKINDWFDKDDFNPQLMEYAIETSVLNQKLSINYIDAILRNWKKSNLRTIEQIQVANAKFSSTRNNFSNQNQPNPEMKLHIPDPKKPI